MIKPHNTNSEFALSGINHVALVCSDMARQKPKDKGVRVGPVLNHDESDAQVAAELHPDVYVRSFYFHDPEGITLEFACWVKEFGDTDIGVERRPRVPAGR